MTIEHRDVFELFRSDGKRHGLYLTEADARRYCVRTDGETRMAVRPVNIPVVFVVCVEDYEGATAPVRVCATLESAETELQRERDKIRVETGIDHDYCSLEIWQIF